MKIHSSTDSRFSESLRLFLQIGAPLFTGNSTPSADGMRFALTTVLSFPNAIVHGRPRPVLGAFDEAPPHGLAAYGLFQPHKPTSIRPIPSAQAADLGKQVCATCLAG